MNPYSTSIYLATLIYTGVDIWLYWVVSQQLERSRAPSFNRQKKHHESRTAESAAVKRSHLAKPQETHSRYEYSRRCVNWAVGSISSF